MTVILGFNAFHADSAACLVVDGQQVGAVDGEDKSALYQRADLFIPPSYTDSFGVVAAAGPSPVGYP